MIPDPNNLAVTNVAPQVNYAVAPQGLTLDPSALAVQPQQAAQPNLAVQVPEGVPQGYGYTDVQGVDAGLDHALTQYNLRTNQGDDAGHIYAEAGQNVRLIDPRSGEVIYQGPGPDAARTVAGIAQSLSEGGGPDKAKKATWQAQVETSDGWSTAAADAKDNPHSNIFKTLLSVGLPIAGSLLLPGLGTVLGSGALAAGGGAAAGSALAGGIQGQSIGKILKNAAISGVGAGLASGAIGGQSLMGGAQSAGGGALQAAGGADVLAGGAGADTLGGAAAGAAAGAGSTVSEVVVTAAQQAARQGLTLTQMIAMGIPAAVGAAAIAGAAGGGATGPLTEMPTQTAVPEQVTAPDTTGLTVSPTPPSQTVLDKALAVVKDNPLLTAALVSAAAGGAGGGGGGKYGTAIPNDAGTRASLDPIFSAKLPASTMGGRQPLAVNTDWATYGMRPEQRFFDNVAETPAAAQGSSLSPQWGVQPNAITNQRLAAMTGYGGAFGQGGFNDWIVQQPEGVKAQARNALRQMGQSERITFATGGHVEGDGDGRSDSIPARLSDGEYVVDAETVALLGDGSAKAGAKKLDQFRVGLRKRKGRELAKGKFSVSAGEPDRYMKGGRA